MNRFQHHSFIFVGGKGGVGKSTSAAALSLALAEQGYRTLIVSTDPAHNLGDIFHVSLHGEETKLADRLWGLEVDSALESKRYIQGVKENLQGMVKSKMIEEVHRQIDLASASPGADEAALFDRLTAIMLEQSNHYDKIVFDTAPTGHTIRLLSLPEWMGVWMDGMLERRKKTNDNYSRFLHDGDPVEDPIYNMLQARKEKFANVRHKMLDQQQTAFVFVLNPERLPILETKQAVHQLDKHHLRVETLIVNKVLPDDADGVFLSKRRKQEEMYVKEIKETFVNQSIVPVPLLEEDISDMERLMEFAAYIRGARHMHGV
ncbi:arsenic transporter ATPase [Pontibacillus litoralis JSM 072002]|uniref:Arsenic transporter ATPase n=1 Tax=Pontibacillus litoralis JSM 072002 TaxID=1385512 RepID=A0A0A5G537_9BACI|nr:arsenic transporter ATPase [Pontibacillus litoralis JSM 072002]